MDKKMTEDWIEATRKEADANAERIRKEAEVRAERIRDAAERKIEFRKKQAEANAKARRLAEELRARLEAEYGMTKHPKRDLLWSKAWDHGHSAGLHDVENWYTDLVELLT